MGIRLSELEREQERRAKRLNDLQLSHEATTHFTDDLRAQLRELSREIGAANGLSEGGRLLAQETALRGEIISAKIKLNRLSSATIVLGSVDYKACPRCGTELSKLDRNGNGLHPFAERPSSHKRTRNDEA